MSEATSTQGSIEQLELEIKQLDRDKRIEEIRQLKASGTRQWITPTALALMLPLLAGFGLWIVDEVKQFNEGYAALRDLDKVRQEKAALETQKNGLNLDVMALSDIKRNQAEQVAALEDRLKEIEGKLDDAQRLLDTTFLLVRFSTAEVGYALGHIGIEGTRPEDETLDKLKQDMWTAAPESSEALDALVEDYRLAIDLVADSRERLASIGQRLERLPVSPWAAELQWVPEGMVGGRSVMVVYSEKDGQVQERYYDVDESRFLTEDEVEAAR